MFDNRNEIKNKAIIKVEYCGERHFIESNEVELNKIDLIVLKRQNKNAAFVGDCVKYTITIYNDSKTDLYNLEFEDKLAKDLKYVRDSFKVNGIKENPCYEHNDLSYRINQLKVKEEIVITFDAIIEKC